MLIKCLKFIAIGVLLCGFLIFPIGCTKTVEINTIKIGALIPVTGDAASNGVAMLEALQIAEEDINDTLRDQGSSKRIELVYADTESDADNVDVLLNSFIDQGIRFIIGPMTSAELLAAQTTINSSDSLIISSSSTLSTLSVADDNIYRFISDDTSTANAIAAALKNEGIQKLAIFYRDDAWGAALAQSVEDAFVASGGTIIDSVGYTALRRSVIQEALDGLNTLVASSDASTTGFQLISLDEGDGIMEDADAYAALKGIRWFGSDGYVRQSIEDAGATPAQFAVQTQYMAPIFGVDLTTMGENLQDQIEEELGTTINIYPLVSYDAFMVAANTLLEIGDDTSLSDLRSRFLDEVDAYDGAIGPISLNDAGDLSDGSYFFWSYVQEGGEYEWQHTMTYSNDEISE